MYKTPPNLVQLLNSYLDDRKFVVRIGNSSSESKTMKAGIPQGGKISPVLYSIYVNDIPTTHKTLLGMYADDTTILARNKNPKYTAAAINQHLQKLDDWFVKWKIALNVSKTEAVYFAKGEKKHKPVIKIKNKIIPWSQQAKYLGIILDNKLTWQSHISSIKTKFRNVTRKLYPLIARDSDMKRKYKILIYTAILRPIITYGCPIWGSAAKSNINKLEVLENNIIRQICKAGWAIPVSIPLHPFLFITPCRVLPKPLDVPDQQTSLVRFLIEELGVPHIAITTIQHDSQPVNLPPFPLLPHRDSNQQNPAAQIVKYSTYHTGD
ncbi:RNA-directed DNA polymerase from mobile element jockey [Araneus ventricosus]|uniref:RNA-directed DNA polymerase from mobile element jockey n=1 Tax=Araneus ventricosus TaxID=182803 RepID=A0A4Y2U9S0_ARAVE|nr:RNA-directed DNA polymerase from mobile element jockey [Araneus ventricosus]